MVDSTDFRHIKGLTQGLFRALVTAKASAEVQKEAKESLKEIEDFLDRADEEMEGQQDKVDELTNKLLGAEETAISGKLAIQRKEFEVYSAKIYAESLRDDLRHALQALSRCHLTIKELGGNIDNMDHNISLSGPEDL